MTEITKSKETTSKQNLPDGLRALAAVSILCAVVSCGGSRHIVVRVTPEVSELLPKAVAIDYLNSISIGCVFHEHGISNHRVGLGPLSDEVLPYHEWHIEAKKVNEAAFALTYEPSRSDPAWILARFRGRAFGPFCDIVYGAHISMAKESKIVQAAVSLGMLLDPGKYRYQPN